MKEIWLSAHMSCNSKIFKDKSALYMTPTELDEICKENGIVWENCGSGIIHIHGCGFECDCHGGYDNLNLRPQEDDNE